MTALSFYVKNLFRGESDKTMDNNKIVMTQAGLDEFKERLEYLKTVKRYEVIERIKVARGYGDLSENAEYDEAKDEQSKVEGEIKEMEAKLPLIQVIDETEIHTDDVSIGSYVTVKDLDYNEEVEYRIVGTTESNIAEGKLSNESPVGKALIGSKVGDVLTIDIPMGKAHYQILAIR